MPRPARRRSIDPLDRVTLDDSVSMALLVVLESLTPAERVAFVLHEVFAVPFAEIAETVGRSPPRLGSSRHPLDGTSRSSGGADTGRRARSPVSAFRVACEDGDLQALIGILDPRWRRPATAAAGCAPRCAPSWAPTTSPVCSSASSPRGRASPSRNARSTAAPPRRPSGRRSDRGRDVRHGRWTVHNLWLMLNPEKLHAWNR